MFSRHRKLYAAEHLPIVTDIKRRHPVLIEFDVRRVIITVFAQPKGHDVVQITNHLIDKRIRVISDNGSAARHQMREFVKRTDNVVDILKIIQMIGIDIQDNFDFWFQTQEAVHIFAGFCNKVTTVTDLDVAADLGQIAADQNGRLELRALEDQGNHRSGRGFTMGTGYRNAVFIFLHQKSQHLRPRENRDSAFFRAFHFGIIVTDGRREHQKVCLLHILRAVSDKYPRALARQSDSLRGFFHVRTADLITSGQQNFCNRRKTDASDADAVYLLILT